MKTSAESMSWYNKVDTTWKSVGVNPNVWKSTPADYKVVCKTIKVLWRKEMGAKFPYDLKEVTGNRDTWCRDRCTFTVNPEKGWAEIIHSLGHWMGYMKNLKRPHCAQHAAMEYRLTKYVAENNLVELSNQELAKPKVKLRVNKVAQRYARMLTRKQKWAKTLKQAERNLAKVEQEITKYERVHSEEKRTTKYLEPIVRKMPPKKDWQAMSLDLAERYEGIKIAYDDYGNYKEIDLWYHGNRPSKWTYERSGEYPCMPRYSWRMIYNLAVETLQDDGVWND
tara:strand:- start:42 stop:884 length:843 start_codon:yes stop_codon:yes gene_type:complete